MGLLSASVFRIRGILFGVYIRAPDVLEFPCRECLTLRIIIIAFNSTLVIVAIASVVVFIVLRIMMVWAKLLS